jgi:hypothetical protein
MNITARAVAMGLFLVLIILSGLWLSRTGRPLNVGISTLHKLISLAAGIYLLVTVIQRHRTLPLGPAQWIAVVATGLCFLAMVATGGLLALDKPAPVAILRVHQIVPALTALSTGASLYLLLS